MSKPTINYWLDLLIGVAFIASAVSGVVFLLPFPLESVLGLTYAQWDVIHTWGSLLMIGGVIAHLALHWKWLTHMTRKTLRLYAPAPRRVQPAGVVVDTERRDFLRLASYTALVAGVTVAGYELLSGVRNSSAAQGAGVATVDSDALIVQTASAEIEQATTSTATPATTEAIGVIQTAADATATPVTINLTPTSTPAPTVATPVTSNVASASRVTVACRKGQVNCPFPGRCHSYRDTNGNGYCDLSQPA